MPVIDNWLDLQTNIPNKHETWKVIDTLNQILINLLISLYYQIDIIWYLTGFLPDHSSYFNLSKQSKLAPSAHSLTQLALSARQAGVWGELQVWRRTWRTCKKSKNKGDFSAADFFCRPPKIIRGTSNALVFAGPVRYIVQDLSLICYFVTLWLYDYWSNTKNTGLWSREVSVHKESLQIA